MSVSHAHLSTCPSVSPGLPDSHARPCGGLPLPLCYPHVVLQTPGSEHDAHPAATGGPGAFRSGAGSTSGSPTAAVLTSSHNWFPISGLG